MVSALLGFNAQSSALDVAWDEIPFGPQTIYSRMEEHQKLEQFPT